jgi:hypothetical protein
MKNFQQYLKLNKPVKVKRGTYTKAYIYTNKVLLRTTDPVKECISFDWFPDSSLFPEVKRTDFEDNDELYNIYESPLYLQGRSMKSLICTEDWNEVYLPLRSLQNTILWGWDSNNWYYKFIEAVDACEGLRKDAKEDIKEAYTACMNYSTRVRFEISPRNIAATREGNLVLLDCFYIK